MSKRLLGRAAVRLYPSHIREAGGEELLGTLLDAGDASLRAFVTELASLILAALKAHSHRALATPVKILIVESLCWSSVITVAEVSIAAVADQARWGGTFQTTTNVLAYYVIPGLLLVAFTTRRTRLAGLLGLLWIAASLGDYRLSFYLNTMFLRGEFAQYFPPSIGFVLMLAAPRRAPSRQNWAWVLPIAVWTACELVVLSADLSAVKVAPVLATLIVAPLQPALALGTALVWTLMLSWYLPLTNGPLPIELACCVPAAVALVALCRRLTRIAPAGP